MEEQHEAPEQQTAAVSVVFALSLAETSSSQTSLQAPGSVLTSGTAQPDRAELLHVIYDIQRFLGQISQVAWCTEAHEN